MRLKKNSLRAISVTKHSAIIEIPRRLRANLRLRDMREAHCFVKEKSNQAATSDPEMGTQLTGLWQ